MNVLVTIGLLLYWQAAGGLPKINYNNFGPGIREQVRQADRIARLHPRDANSTSVSGWASNQTLTMNR